MGIDDLAQKRLEDDREHITDTNAEESQPGNTGSPATDIGEHHRIGNEAEVQDSVHDRCIPTVSTPPAKASITALVV